jgi:two-component system, OmpR family, sensor histidine kinase KdpD
MQLLRREWRVTLEIAAALVVASLAVDALDRVTPVTGVAVVYLLAVLAIAIRRGELPALVTAVLSVLVLNFFFLPPVHRLTIADSRNVVALAVFLVTAAVVGRLAASARHRTREADVRAAEAAARGREAALLATTASSLLGRDGRWQPPDVRRAAARIDLAASPSPTEDEFAVRLPTREESCWLYVTRSDWAKKDAKRIAAPLADVIDLELGRRRLAETAADAEAARRADVAKTALLHAVSHDLRSPLAAITAATGALNSGVLDDADREELLSVIEGESARLERLIGDLLALSRIEAGAVDPDIDWCDLRDTVATAAEHVRTRRGDYPIAIALPADLPLVKADPVQMERVFENLIENAMKFSPDGAGVRIDGGGSEARVTVRVSDRGRGIPPSQRAHVFEPFWRGRDGAPGSGLGLAICRGFVEANGGRIQLQSRPGEGSSFSVSFPAAPQPSEVR